MASAWGTSWSDAWGLSWGTAVAPPSVTPVRKLSLTGRVQTALSLVGSVTVSRLPQSLSCVYGEAVEITLTMDAPPAGGVSGWTLGFWLKKSQGADPPAPVVTKTSGAGIALVDATAGVWTVTLAGADTRQTPGTYYLDCWRTDAGDEAALAQGRLSIGDTTRP
jgi:hypothetical protein